MYMRSTRRPPFRAGLAVLSALCAVSTVSASPVPSPNIIFAARDSGSCAANYSPCTNANFPSDFCCQAGTKCIALAGNTTVLCCPTDSDCAVIQPIPCGLQLQNATAYPEAVIKTTVFDGELGHCGDGRCCPWGYTCNSSGNCALDSDQSQPPPSQASASSSSSSPTASATTTDSNSSPSAITTSSSSDESTTAEPSVTPVKSGSPSSGGLIAGIVIAITIVGILGVCVATTCIRKAKAKSKSLANDREGAASRGNIISAPILAEGSTMRSDFTRKSPGQYNTNIDNHAMGGFAIPLETRSNRHSQVSSLSDQMSEKAAGDRPESDPFTTPTRGVPPIRSLRPSSGSSASAHVKSAAAQGYKMDNPFDDDDESVTDYRRRDIYAPSIYSPAGQPYANHEFNLGAHHIAGLGKAKAVREPSSGTIDVSFDPSAQFGPPPIPMDEDWRRGSNMTTATAWPSMLDKAGLPGVGDGVPFVPASAYTPDMKGRGKGVAR